MAIHKFHVGTIVRSQEPRGSEIPPGSYEVVRQLPSGDGARDLQYQVKATFDGHQRVVKESNLC